MATARCLVAGGLGAIGTELLRLLVPKYGSPNVFVYDLQGQADRWPALARSLGVPDSNCCLVGPTGAGGVTGLAEHYHGWFDILVLSTPPQETLAVFEALWACVSKGSGSLVVDVLSVKSEAGPHIDAQCRAHGVNYLSVHPLFGASVFRSMHGHIVARVSTDALFDRRRVDEFMAVFGDAIWEDHIDDGRPITCELHDQLTAWTQALTHFTFFAFLNALSTSGFRIKSLYRLRTPPFANLLALACRTLGTVPERTLLAIQDTPFAGQARGALREATARLAACVDVPALRRQMLRGEREEQGYVDANIVSWSKAQTDRCFSTFIGEVRALSGARGCLVAATHRDNPERQRLGVLLGLDIDRAFVHPVSRDRVIGCKVVRLAGEDVQLGIAHLGLGRRVLQDAAVRRLGERGKYEQLPFRTWAIAPLEEARHIPLRGRLYFDIVPYRHEGLLVEKILALLLKACDVDGTVRIARTVYERRAGGPELVLKMAGEVDLRDVPHLHRMLEELSRSMGVEHSLTL